MDQESVESVYVEMYYFESLLSIHLDWRLEGFHPNSLPYTWMCGVELPAKVRVESLSRDNADLYKYWSPHYCH